MIDINRGRYWDEGIELVSGCTPCSPGCDHCWALAGENRFKKCSHCGTTKKKCDEYKEISIENRACDACCSECDHSGTVTVHPDRLSRFKTRKPKVFAIWNDLFHEAVPFNFQFDIYYKFLIPDVRNTFLVLTKRPHIMAKNYQDILFHIKRNYGCSLDLNNIWHGLTVCNQREADEKIPVFLQVPGKKFLSLEPLLGMIDLESHLWTCDVCGVRCDIADHGLERSSIDAVILGGETGPGARPLHPDWVRSIRSQCAAAGVPCFFKQWGEWCPMSALIKDDSWPKYIKTQHSLDTDCFITEEYRPRACSMIRVGRNKAGRLLDGRTHDDLPWRKA
ncbi:MAG: DUF5131 family protein [Candidatus Omnitrophota bacterium]|jgi:protein gp37